MSRFFVPLDVNYQMDDKLMCAGPLAECIYVRALAFSKRASTEGRIRRAHLRVLGVGIRNATRHAEILVECGLWTTDGDGWYIVGWLNHNLSNDALTEEKARKRALSIAGNHKRHHVAKGVTDDDCELCHPPKTGTETLPHDSRTGQKTVAREDEQKTKTNRREDEEESSSVPDKSTTRRPNAAAAALKLLLAHKLTTATTPGLKPMLEKALPDEWRNPIADYLSKRPTATAEEIASVVLGVPGQTYTPADIKQPWYANPCCLDCGGEGFRRCSDGWLEVCPCRQSDPYVANVTPIRPT